MAAQSKLYNFQDDTVCVCVCVHDSEELNQAAAAFSIQALISAAFNWLFFKVSLLFSHNYKTEKQPNQWRVTEQLLSNKCSHYQSITQPQNEGQMWL